MVISKSLKSSLSLFCMLLLRRDRCLLHLPNEDQRGLRSSQFTQPFRGHCQSLPCTGAFGWGACTCTCVLMQVGCCSSEAVQGGFNFFYNIIRVEETHVCHSVCGGRRAACGSLISPSTMGLISPSTAGPTAQAQILRLSSLT